MPLRGASGSAHKETGTTALSSPSDTSKLSSNRCNPECNTSGGTGQRAWLEVCTMLSIRPVVVTALSPAAPCTRTCQRQYNSQRSSTLELMQNQAFD
eukprot:CAMPEP_0180694608 /NCGR_PEP_ID=MMETSP1038_2-20121128/2002_1 /TAXON_ID=632150 /ORGANISM="Azadinium spinosum, Strain 3D9" /LENGTH=96 /DNA_ID=CAMNT_0022725963 /DNA_START=659 /DNA_END=946 /DNA_ORIENTATION=-